VSAAVTHDVLPAHNFGRRRQASGRAASSPTSPTSLAAAAVSATRSATAVTAAVAAAAVASAAVLPADSADGNFRWELPSSSDGDRVHAHSSEPGKGVRNNRGPF
jgi:hypothetical protein